ncbi:MAG: LysR family transcriptional regulator [Chthoniobacter sp.]|nr:LysR family transcriptional regulator [Chthoniobacter sp.]
MITFGQLRCFVAVAQELNFRRAARRLNMSQPPLSRQVQALEHAVGAALVQRDARAVCLTPAGQGFARAARRLLQQAAEAVQEAQRIDRGDAGTLRIGFTAASSYVFLPRLVALLRVHLPALELTLREMTTPQQVVALQAGQIDLGLMRPFAARVGLRTRRVWREPLALAVPAAHGLARQETVALGDIAGETLITYPPVEGPYFHDLIFGLLNVAGVIPARVQHITQTHSILALVQGGLGVALVPRSAEQCLPAGVTLRVPEDEVPAAELVLAWAAEEAQTAVAAVLGLVGTHAEQLERSSAA